MNISSREIVYIVQARMGSKRFPGKTLYPIQGKPCLEHLLDSLFQHAGKSEAVIATSSNPEDDQIEEFAKSRDLQLFRGDPENVAYRFKLILETSKAASFVRLNGDSPLLDYRILVEAERIAEASSADIVSTVALRGVPSGMNVELFRSALFLKHYPKFSKPEHFEHVTSYFYENRSQFGIIPISCGINKPTDYKFTFDTPEDKERLVRFFSALQKPHYLYTLEEKCRIYRDLFGPA